MNKRRCSKCLDRFENTGVRQKGGEELCTKCVFPILRKPGEMSFREKLDNYRQQKETEQAKSEELSLKNNSEKTPVLVP
jgi:hypothetical protein